MQSSVLNLESDFDSKSAGRTRTLRDFQNWDSGISTVFIYYKAPECSAWLLDFQVLNWATALGLAVLVVVGVVLPLILFILTTVCPQYVKCDVCLEQKKKIIYLIQVLN